MTNTRKLAIAWMLGMIAIASLTSIIGFSFLEKEVPQALIVFGSVAVGALGSLLTHSK